MLARAEIGNQLGTGFVMNMKEWFGNKLATELGRNLQDSEIFAVIKETEKALYVMVSVGVSRSKCTWIPKSAVEMEQVEKGCVQTIKIEDYNKCLETFKSEWSQYI